MSLFTMTIGFELACFDPSIICCFFLWVRVRLSLLSGHSLHRYDGGHILTGSVIRVDILNLNFCNTPFNLNVTLLADETFKIALQFALKDTGVRECPNKDNCDIQPLLTPKISIFALLAIYEGNPPVNGRFSSQRASKTDS